LGFSTRCLFRPRSVRRSPCCHSGRSYSKIRSYLWPIVRRPQLNRHLQSLSHLASPLLMTTN